MAAHTVEEITRRLRLGLVAETDNRDALLELGFSRAYPQMRDDYHARLWSRAVTVDDAAAGGLNRKRMAIQLAFLADRRAAAAAA